MLDVVGYFVVSYNYIESMGNMKYKEPLSTPLAAKDFLLSDKPPDRRMLRIVPRYIRWGYFAIVSILLSALLISPNYGQLWVFIGFAIVMACYLIVRRIFARKQVWLFTENAAWVNGLAGIVAIAIFYLLFRITGYGYDETDPANV